MREIYEAFLKNLIAAYHSGEVTLRAMRTALLVNFSDLENLSLATLSKFLRIRTRLSKRKENPTNFTIRNINRPSQIIRFAENIDKIYNSEK